MAAATNTITTPRKRFRARIISRKRWDGRPSTIRPTADSSARSENGWTIGRSCARSAVKPGDDNCYVARHSPLSLFPRLDEIQNLVGQAGVRGIDRIRLRHVAVLRQQDAADAAMLAFAEAVFQKIELLVGP